jgi:hypothetical protein
MSFLLEINQNGRIKTPHFKNILGQKNVKGKMISFFSLTSI